MDNEAAVRIWFWFELPIFLFIHYIIYNWLTIIALREKLKALQLTVENNVANNGIVSGDKWAIVFSISGEIHKYISI